MPINPEKDAWNNLIKALKEYSQFDSDYDYVLYHLENEITLGGSEISENLKGKTSADEILHQAISHFGENAQIIKAIEELSELSTELARYLNFDVDPNHDILVEKHVFEELADVIIMCDQMRIVFEGHSTDSVDDWIAKKLNRLGDMVRGGSTSIEFIESLPLRKCTKCDRDFHSENPCKWDGHVVCDDCMDELSRGDSQ